MAIRTKSGASPLNRRLPIPLSVILCFLLERQVTAYYRRVDMESPAASKHTGANLEKAVYCSLNMRIS